MDIESARSTALEFLAAAGGTAGILAAIRGKKNQSDTEAQVESAKQSSVGVYVDQLAAVSKALTQERADRVADAEAARDREADLRKINDQVRAQFSASLDQFRETLAARDDRIGGLVEDVAEWRGKAEALQFEKLDLQAAVQRQRIECNEEKRALTASHERVTATMRADYASLEERNHSLVNQLYGDGTATNIMGPST